MDHAHDGFGIPADADESRGAHRTQEMQSGEIHSGHTRHDSALVHGAAIFVKHGEIDPREARMVSGAPDDVSHIERTIICEQRLTTSHSNDPRYAFNSGVDQIARFHADQRSGLGQEFRTQSAADGIVDVQYLMADKFNQAHQEESRKRSLDSKRNMTGFLAGHPDFSAGGARDFDSDVGCGISRADDQHGTIQELRRVGVVVRVNL